MTPFGDTYDVVYSDPPWHYRSGGSRASSAAKHYHTVRDEDMVELARPPLNERGVLFMWATCPRLDFALDLIREWGLHYRGVAFVWVKTRRDGTPIGARGVRPTIVKPLTEMVLAASPVKVGRPLPLADESIVQTVLEPVREHSRKPDEVRTRIERLYPGAKRLEMFARTTSPGWSSWGDQAGLFDPS